MYTALIILLGCMLLGKCFRTYLPEFWLRKAIMGAIFLLLFLLGVSLGGNGELLSRLPSLGMRSLLLMVFCVWGSIVAAFFAGRFLRRFVSDKTK